MIRPYTKHKYRFGDDIHISIIAYKRLKRHKPRLVEGIVTLDNQHYIPHNWIKVKHHEIDLTWNQYNGWIKHYKSCKIWKPSKKQQEFPFAYIDH